jgi:AraC-like DNA-binding protein
MKRAQLMDEAGISQECLQNPAGCIPVEKMYILWDSAIRLTKDQMFALHAAERVPFGTFRLLDYMLAASSTTREALARANKSFGIMNNTFLMLLRLRGAFAYLELHNPGDPQNIPRPYIEYILTNYLMRLRFATQTECRPSEVHVTYEQPPLTNEYDRIFGAPFRFRQAINCMVFPGHLMEVRHPLADPELCELLDAHAQRKLQQASCEKHPLADIHDALAHNLEMGNVTLAFLSRQVAKSCRSLQREIQANGLTFRELLDNVRQQRAVVLLRERDLPITEVAFRLHFSDSSSFCRAFQRWTGQSPLQYRNHLN